MKNRLFFSLILLMNFKIIFSQGSNCLQGVSSHNSIYTDSPQAMAFGCGDFNNDGKTDFAFTNGNNRITVMQGDGGGGFQVSGVYTITTNQGQIIIAKDINGDAKLDLVVSTMYSGVYVLLGNGTGTFGLPINYSTTGGQISMVTGDFNNDNKPDFATVAINNSFINILINNGSGGFLTNFTLAVGFDPNSIEACDYNNDGQVDLVTANKSSNSISIIQGNGNGTFAPSFSLSAIDPNAIISGDLNGDNIQDLAVANYSLNTVTVLAGNGSGGFSQNAIYPVDYAPSCMKAADINGDGIKDILTLSWLQNNMSVLISNGLGTYNQTVNYALGNVYSQIELLDFNNDLKLDLLVSLNHISGPPAMTYYGNVALIKGMGNGVFSCPRSYNAGFWPSDITSNDFNSDGLPDLAVTNDSVNLPFAKTIAVLFNSGNGLFGAPVIINVGSPPGAITSADYNADGKPDLAVALASGFIKILINNGQGNFNSQFSYVYGPSSSDCKSLISRDFNADGKTDLAFANYDTHIMGIMLNSGNAVFGLVGSGFGCSYARSVTAGDFNGDGKVDLACEGAQIIVGWGNGAGSFSSTSVILSSIPSPHLDYITSGDFNNDGKDDLVAMGKVYLSDTLGGFYPGVSYPAISGPFGHKIVADINGDNNADLVSTLYNLNKISIYLGDGTGKLEDVVWYDLGGNIGLVAKDFNGDGLLDIASSGPQYFPGSGTLGVLLNSSQQVNVSIVAPNVACSNVPFILTATGANTYSWSTGAQTNTISATQNQTSSYVVWGTVYNGCSDLAQKSVSVSNISVTQVNGTVCLGETVLLSASGAITYTWSNYAVGPTTTMTAANTTYTLIGTDVGNCVITKTMSLFSSICDDVDESVFESDFFSVFPNPTNRLVNIVRNDRRNPVNVWFQLYNITGLVEREILLLEETTTLDINKLSPNIYFYRIFSDGALVLKGKLIVN